MIVDPEPGPRIDTMATAAAVGKPSPSRPAMTEARSPGTSQSATVREEIFATIVVGKKSSTCTVTPDPVGACTDESSGEQVPDVDVVVGVEGLLQDADGVDDKAAVADGVMLACERFGERL